jgi:hypothetical protein
MTIFVPSTPFGYTIFCDDIRQESNGKLIYLGVYQTDMTIFGTFPAILPTFTMMIRYNERRTDSGDPVTIKIFVPGNDQPVFQVTIDTATMRSALPRSDLPGEDEIISTLIPVRLSPLQIETEGRIKVRAYKGDDEIRLGTLNVRIVPLPSPTQPAPVT